MYFIDRSILTRTAPQSSFAVSQSANVIYEFGYHQATETPRNGETKQCESERKRKKKSQKSCLVATLSEHGNKAIMNSSGGEVYDWNRCFSSSNVVCALCSNFYYSVHKFCVAFNSLTAVDAYMCKSEGPSQNKL